MIYTIYHHLPFKSDSPNTRKYKMLLTCTSSKIASTATGSTADMRALNTRHCVMVMVKSLPKAPVKENPYNKGPETTDNKNV